MKASIRHAMHIRVASALKAFGAILSSQFTWLILFAFGAAGCFSLGVYILHGLGWSLIACGMYFMLFATIIFRGIANG